MYINNNKGDNRICYLLFFIKNLKYFLLSESLKIRGEFFDIINHLIF